ncbi:MAG TPA: universal stress protein [Pseudomonas sp.]|jgi:nucleotide-binding universal stress UspA family protein|nr:universal stress protein [Pseudomonas sp.]
MRNVLVAFDGSDSSKRAIQYLIDFARDHSATLEVSLLNVQQPPIVYGEYMTGDLIERMEQSASSQAQHMLDWPAEQLQAAGITHSRHTAQGNIPEQIGLAVKKLNCDTVVMGTRGLGNFSGLLMGSVATRVVHEVPVPVLLVK